MNLCWVASLSPFWSRAQYFCEYHVVNETKAYQHFDAETEQMVNATAFKGSHITEMSGATGGKQRGAMEAGLALRGSQHRKCGLKATVRK